MAKREFLMQAHKYNASKHDIRGWFVSEKLDGMRCLWDGGASRGDLASNVPWANVAKDKKEFRATGLWSRKGKVIHAPDWWLDKLPLFPLDGELFAGRGLRQKTMSYARKHIPVNSEWEHLKLHVFEAPSIHSVFDDGRYYDTNCDVTITQGIEYCRGGNYIQDISFSSKQEYLLDTVVPSTSFRLHDQQLLSHDINQVNNTIDTLMDSVLASGGEGLVFRDPSSLWEPHRSHSVLKLKPYFDDEAIVIGYVSGRETDRGSKLRGLMGALVVDYGGKTFELSGFTDHERRLAHAADPEYGFEYAYNHPGESMPNGIYSPEFPKGSTITFKYRELSLDGIPIEASYFRKR